MDSLNPFVYDQKKFRFSDGTHPSSEFYLELTRGLRSYQPNLLFVVKGPFFNLVKF